MERYEMMVKEIKDYRHERKNEKRKYLNDHYDDIFVPLLRVMEPLVRDAEKKQTLNQQGKIQYLVFHRLLSSGYTGSYEMSMTMSNAALYLDENMSCVYWKPEIVYRGLEDDMKRVHQILSNKYSRIEEYELIRLKQCLLLDDWDIFCEVLRKIAERLAERIKESPLQLEDEIRILCGEYMGRLDVVYTMQTDSLPSNDKYNPLFDCEE